MKIKFTDIDNEEQTAEFYFDGLEDIEAVLNDFLDSFGLEVKITKE